MAAQLCSASLLSLMLALGLDSYTVCRAGAAGCAALAAAEQLRRRGGLCQVSLGVSILNMRVAFSGSLPPGARV